MRKLLVLAVVGVGVLLVGGAPGLAGPWNESQAENSAALLEYSLELAVPGPEGWQFGEIHFYAIDDGTDPVVRMAEGRAAMLARFPGAVVLEPGDVSAQFKLFPTPVRWPAAAASWSYNPTGATLAMPGASALGAIKSGAAGWDDAGGSGWHFDYFGETDTATGCNGDPSAYVKDGKNVVGWGHIVGGHLGYSCHWRSASLVAGTPYFAIQEIDIIFEPGASYTSQQLQALALHEFGHALGLDHTEPAACPGKAMCSGSNADDFSAPQSDDIFGVIALYGVAAAPTPTPPVVPPGPRPHKAYGPLVARD